MSSPYPITRPSASVKPKNLNSFISTSNSNKLWVDNSLNSRERNIRIHSNVQRTKSRKLYEKVTKKRMDNSSNSYTIKTNSESNDLKDYIKQLDESNAKYLEQIKEELKEKDEKIKNQEEEIKKLRMEKDEEIKKIRMENYEDKKNQDEKIKELDKKYSMLNKIISKIQPEMYEDLDKINKVDSNNRSERK